MANYTNNTSAMNCAYQPSTANAPNQYQAPMYTQYQGSNAQNWLPSNMNQNFVTGGNNMATDNTVNSPSNSNQLDQSFVTNEQSTVPETLTNNAFLPAYLAANIGNWARISLLIGDNITEVVGEIWMVGASYVIVKTLEPYTTIMVDLFSIKMVTIIYDEDFGRLIRV